MQKTLIEILPLALAAAMSPSGLLLVFTILSGKKDPKRGSLAFVLGSMLFLIVLGLLVMLTFNPAVKQANHPEKISAIIDIVLGSLILVVTGRSLLVKKKEKKASGKSRKRPYFVIGFFYMVVNTSTLIPFIAASKIIAENSLGPGGSVIAFVYLLVITMSLISLPVIMTFLLPAQSEKILGPLKSFMSRHGARIAQVFFLVIAVYLIARGVVDLRA